MLHEARDGLDACGPRKLLDLGELALAIGTLLKHRDDEAPLRIGTGLRVGSASTHAWIMAVRSELSMRRTASSSRSSGTVSDSRTKPSPLGQ